MPIIKLQGLKGLPGLNHLSDREKAVFYNANKDILNTKNFRSPRAMDRAADILYNNKLFVNKFGQNAFDQYNNGTEEAYNLRNTMLKNSIIEEEWNKYLSPFNADGTRDNSKGLGNQWETYNEMSPDAKLRLMESDWLSPKEFNDQWKKEGDEIEKAYHNTNPLHNIGGLHQAMGRAIAEEISHGEATKQLRTEENNRILERIYNDDLEQRTNELGSEVNSVYLSPEIASLSDDGVKKAFYNNFIADNSDMIRLGKGELASHWGESELKDLSVDDMRQWLAKKQVYMQNMSPNAAGTALNNEAKKYIKDHQGTLKRIGLFAKDVGISAMSYTADKANGIYNLGLMVADAVSDKPTVYMDDTGNIIDPNKTKLGLGSNGTYNYKDAQGKQHTVRQVQIDRTTLHNMGKNFDGSEDESILNPQYWSRAEQFGTLDSDLQKKYEKLGSSPYKVAYNPNEDSDLWYESFKMASFGLADAASQLIPFGIGAAGKALSTANKVGRIGRGLGKAIDFGGKALTAQTKFGQVAQGTASALGIAYAYNRGAFQETLAQNLTNAEETLNNRARNEIYNEYNSNKSYKRAVDMQIDEEAAKLKKEYLAQMQKDGGMQPADMKAIDKLVRSQAQQNVLQGMVDNRTNELKGSKEYADLQQEAINSAGDAATTTFLPEAVKYGFVNTIGFRKYLYTNPAGVTRRVSNTLKGLKEITTEGGKQRLATEASKFLTKGQKWKQLGKAALSQAWGGAWTNGTDDMMTDAAERINSDSFDRYLNGFYNGEAVADIYGFADGLFSYLKGFSNSLGQETTMNATLVGALGSLVSASPNMTNIAHLVTKSGRENYRNNFWREVKRNDDGTIQRNEDGSPKVEKLSKLHDLPAQLNYFVQNGVLNTYYGKKQAEKDLQSHADYVNNILDDYNDFEDIERLVVSDRALDDADGFGDQKTARFIKAIHAINALNSLANNSRDPAVMSSVVQNAKAQIASLTERNFNPETDNIPQNEVTQNLLSQYYAQNPSISQNDYTARQGLATMINNAEELSDAAEAYNNAEAEVAKAERNYGHPFAIPVREKLKLNQALDGHWRKRLDSMRQEIGDTSTEGEVSDENILPTLGGKKNAQLLVRAYEKQKKELSDEYGEQLKVVDEKRKKVNDAQKELDDNTDEGKTYDLQKKVSDANAELQDAQLQLGYIDNQLTTTQIKQKRVQDVITASEQEGATTKQLLTADEILSLDPKTRAKMMRKENRDLYSDEQKGEIEKLEHKLIMQDADALQKIQDISTLSQRIEANSDAYNRIMENPEAAAVRFEAQRSADVVAAYRFVNQRNAQSAADFITEYDDAMKAHPDIDKETKERFVYRALRRLNTNLLDIIDTDQLLPQYQQQVSQAKEWSTVTEDLDAVISSQLGKDQAWRDNVRQNIDGIVETANNRDEIISNIEKAIDDVDNPQAKQDLDLILKGMERLGYQRDASVLENRKKKQEREAEERRKIEEQKKKVSDAARAAAEEKAAKEEEARNAAQNHEVPANGEGLVPTETITPDDAAPANNVNADGSNLEGTMETPKFAEDAEETGKPKTVSWVSALMDNDAEEGSMDAGDMWQGTKGNAKQSNFKVTLKKSGMTSEREITFSNGNAVDNLSIAPDEWATSANDPNVTTKEELDKEGITKDTPFTAHSLYSVNGNWYFNGGFIGHKGEYRLRVSDKFDLDNAIERQKSEREADLMAQGVDTDNPNVVIDGNTVEVKSDSLEQQNEDSGNNSKEQHVSDNNTDVSTANTVGESNIENSVNTLSGNAMSEYDPIELEENGVLKHKQGASANDSMSKFYAWMKNAGIHLQNIIDDELSQIIAKNPHAKVRFMSVKPESNATHDVDVQNHLFLVLDYDDNINRAITKIHNDDNGGVISSNGKQYLIIGVAGYGSKKNTDKLALYDILFSNNPHGKNGYGLMRRGRKKYFDEHPDDRYYVSESHETEIVPNSLIPGYIVRQLEDDSNPEYRSITEILKDDKRNPHGFELSSLSWGIQELSKYLVVTPPHTTVNYMKIRNEIRNLGSAFVLIPAANGKMVPAYLKPLFYNEMHDGKLKDRINSLLNQVTAFDYNDRLAAAIELCKIFYFDTKDKGGDNILLRQSRAEISLVSGGEVFATFTLDSNFDRQAFLDAFSTMNPRINITARVLQNESLLKEWDEAGALETDAAKLGTAGSSYSIYALDAEGNMIAPKETVDNRQHQEPVDSDYRRDNRSQVVFKHKYYTLNNGTYYLNGIPVTDEVTLQQLDYNRRISEGNLEPALSEGKTSYYILSQGDNPEIIKVNENTKEVTRLSDEKAKDWLERQAKKEAEKQRQKAAEEALKQKPDNVEDVELGIDEDTGEAIVTEGQQKEGQERQTTETKEKEEKPSTPVSVTPAYKATSATQSFTQLYRNPKHMMAISKLVKAKWADAPKKPSDLYKFLKDKNIEVDAIGTSQEDIDAWIKTVQDCR